MWHAQRMMLKAALIALVFGSNATPASSRAAPVPSLQCPADSKLAMLVAASDLVLVGRMDLPKQRLAEEAQKPSPDYLDISIQIERVLKGGDVRSATVRFYPQDAPYKPSNKAVLGMADASVILFLTRVEEGPVGLYFAGYSPDALKLSTEDTIGAARAEVLRQRQIVRSWRADAALPRFNEVQAQIAHLGRVSGNEQQRVFERLEALGAEAVPAIIAQMDDRRPLRTQAISLVNHAQEAFEGIRHYGPEQVVDGLDAVLNQITGASFGEIANGGSDRERDAAVAGWRVFAADIACKTDG